MCSQKSTCKRNERLVQVLLLSIALAAAVAMSTVDVVFVAILAFAITLIGIVVFDEYTFVERGSRDVRAVCVVALAVDIVAVAAAGVSLRPPLLWGALLGIALADLVYLGNMRQCEVRGDSDE